MIPIDELSEEDETDIIEKVAEKIHQHKMEAPSILLLETSKPLSFIASQLGKLYLTPILPLLKEDLGVPAEKILVVFEKRENIEQLLQLIDKKQDDEW